MKKRLLSLVLCLVMVFALFPTFAAPAMAADADVITNPQPITGDLNLSKELSAGENGTYDLTLEAWSTGNVEYTTYTEKIPTDFVVIVDQSGSMASRDMSVGTNYSRVNNVALDTAANGEYYYYDTETAQYYRVFGQRGYMYQRYAGNTYYADTYVGDDVFYWFTSETNEAQYDPLNLFYYRDASGKYYKVHTRVRGVLFNYECYFWYVDDNGVQHDFGNADRDLLGRITGYNYDYRSAFGGRLDWFCEKIQEVFYKVRLGNSALYYRDVNGKVKVVQSTTSGIGTAEFCNSNGEAITSATGNTLVSYNNLYTYNGTKEERLTSLETALNTFVGEVAKERDSFGLVDNRIAIVGFSSEGSTYSNNEVLTGTSISVSNAPGRYRNDNNSIYFYPYYSANYQNSTNSNASRYNGAQYGTQQATNAYPNALLNAAVAGTFGTVNPDLTKAIKSITAHGGTKPEYGFNMAQSIYQAYEDKQDTTYTLRSGDDAGTTVPRNKIVIFFTDGEPGDDDFANRYSEANTVVEKAKALKDAGATVFTIGVFGESDSQPLTYPYKPRDNEIPENNFNYVKTSGGRILFRQWNHSDPSYYGDIPSDTIFDYMSVVSSNYRNATYFINPAWLNRTMPADATYLDAIAVRGAGYQENGELVNKYYRMASNQQSLIEAFREAVTLTTQQSSSSTTVNIDDTAVFRDKVNLEDFDVSNARYTVQWQPVRMQNGSLVNDGAAQTKVNSETVPVSGVVETSGFDYSSEEFYVTADSSGYKLIVTITGLTPKKASGTLHSNKDVQSGDSVLYGAGVYGANQTAPAIQIASPTLELTGSHDKTYIIDFNAAMKVATGASQLKADTRENPNGEFTKAGNGDVTYKLNGGLNDKTFTASYSGVDSAMVYGQPVGETSGTAWNKITTVPANNIYFDDDLGQLTATENGSGFNGEVGMLKEETPAVGTYTFTFTGSRIDIYCTTDGDASAVTAVLKEGDTVIKRKAISNKYQDAEIGALYNVPSVVFEAKDGVVAGHTYTVTLTAKQDSNYKLDGVRVYKAVAETGDVKTAYDNAQEANSTFLKVRDYLLTSSMISTVNQYLDDLAAYNALEDKEGVEPPAEPENIPGIAFYKDVAYEEGADQYAKLADYVKTGPKNEIYLAKDEVVSFVIKNCPTDMQVWIGLSAPAGDTAGTVEINDVTYTPDIDSTVDMYYKVTPKVIEGEQTLKIKNIGDSVISITNVKITGSNATNPSLNAKVLSVAEAEPAEDGAPYLAVTPKLLARMSAPAQAEDPQPTPTADPEPTPTADPEPTPTQPGIAEWISNLLSSFVNALFGSIARLFGN